MPTASLPPCNPIPQNLQRLVGSAWGILSGYVSDNPKVQVAANKAESLLHELMDVNDYDVCDDDLFVESAIGRDESMEEFLKRTQIEVAKLQTADMRLRRLQRRTVKALQELLCVMMDMDKLKMSALADHEAAFDAAFLKSVGVAW